MLRQRIGELADELGGGDLDDADAAPVLRNRPRQGEVGVEQHLRPAIGRFEMEIDNRIGGAATLRIVAVRRNARPAIGVVDLLELDDAPERQGDRPQPHTDLSLVGLLIDYLGEFGTGHARHDPLDVEQKLPRLGWRKRNCANSWIMVRLRRTICRLPSGRSAGL